MIFFYVAKDHLPRSKINIFKLQEMRIAMTRLRHFLLRQNSTIDNQALARIFRSGWRIYPVPLGEIMQLVCLADIFIHWSHLPTAARGNHATRLLNAHIHASIVHLPGAGEGFIPTLAAAWHLLFPDFVTFLLRPNTFLDNHTLIAFTHCRGGLHALP